MIDWSRLFHYVRFHRTKLSSCRELTWKFREAVSTPRKTAWLENGGFLSLPINAG